LKKPATSVRRDVAAGQHAFKEVFLGFERIPAVRETFGRETTKTLAALKVEVQDTRGYMHIDDEKGCIVVNLKYLREGPETYLHLDAVHELMHIRQFLDGKELFDRSYKYFERPTEVEAYVSTVKEARRIGMDDDQLAEYLRVEWVTDEEFRLFLNTLGVKPTVRREAA
jgi:hypothetical protein